MPDDALLVMEVADTTFRYDLKIKLPYFAAAAIPEVWIQDVNDDLLHVFRKPQGNTFFVSLKLDRVATVSPLAFPEVRFSMSELFGTP